MYLIHNLCNTRNLLLYNMCTTRDQKHMYKRGLRLLSINYSSDCLRSPKPHPPRPTTVLLLSSTKEKRIFVQCIVQKPIFNQIIWSTRITPLRWCSWENTIIFCPREKSLKNVSFGPCPNYPSPPSPQFGKGGPLFLKTKTLI